MMKRIEMTQYHMSYSPPDIMAVLENWESSAGTDLMVLGK